MRENVIERLVNVNVIMDLRLVFVFNLYQVYIYQGSACQRSTCPSGCSGNGRYIINH